MDMVDYYQRALQSVASQASLHNKQLRRTIKSFDEKMLSDSVKETMRHERKELIKTMRSKAQVSKTAEKRLKMIREYVDKRDAVKPSEHDDQIQGDKELLRADIPTWEELSRSPAVSPAGMGSKRSAPVLAVSCYVPYVPSVRMDNSHSAADVEDDA